MEKFKIYQNVNASDIKSSFSIAKMEEIYARRKGAIDEPHRHDFYTVLLIEKGRGAHKIDFNNYKLDDHQIFFVSPGQVHQVIEEVATKGYALTFSSQFLVLNAIHMSFIDSLSLFQEYGQSPPLLPSLNQFSKLKNFATQIFDLYNSDSKMKELSIGAYLKLFLIECDNICSIDPISLNSDISEGRIIHTFKEKVNQFYKKEHSTSFYADQMHITPDHLNRMIKSTIGKTAKEYIQSRITTEAKRLLYFSDLTNKEIGYELGFSEPTNFSAFFKNCTSISPTEFRKTELQS